MNEPIFEVLTSKEVVAGIAALAVAFLTLLGAFIRWGVAWVNRKILSLQTQMADISESASKAETEARGAREGVTNTHGTHLRDDLDEVRDLQLDQGVKLAAIAAKLDQQAEAQERRDRRAEDQIDGLRDDLRQVNESAAREHRVIHARIDDVKGVCPAFMHGPPPC